MLWKKTSSLDDSDLSLYYNNDSMSSFFLELSIYLKSITRSKQIFTETLIHLFTQTRDNSPCINDHRDLP